MNLMEINTRRGSSTLDVTFYTIQTVVIVVVSTNTLIESSRRLGRFTLS